MNTREKEALKELLESTPFISQSLLQASLDVDFVKAKKIINELTTAGIISEPKIQYRCGFKMGDYGIAKFIEQCFVREVYPDLIWAVDMLWNE